jgi:hypothetical protein
VATEVLARTTARVDAVTTAEVHVVMTEVLRVHVATVRQRLQQSRATSRRCSNLLRNHRKRLATKVSLFFYISVD